MAAFVLSVVAVLVMVLIGQRMPLMLTGLGLVAAALLLPRLRLLVFAAGVAGLVLVAASPIVSPPTYHRLVQKFSHQMEDLPASRSGQLYARAWHIAEARPLVGRGFDGSARSVRCRRYFGPTFDGVSAAGRRRGDLRGTSAQLLLPGDEAMAASRAWCCSARR